MNDETQTLSAVSQSDDQAISQIVRGDASFETLKRVATMFATSGLFRTTDDLQTAVAAAGTKILAGAELGFGPFQSMANIYVLEIKGRPQIQIGATLMASMIRRGGYDYMITEHTDQVCAISFSRKGQVVGESRFTFPDAIKAGLAGKDVWRRNPRNMLFARAISNGAKWYCPDVLGGAVYTEGDAFVGESDFAPIGDAPIEPQAIKQPDPISKRDACRIFEVARDGTKPLSNDEIKVILHGFGYADTASIVKSDYEPIITAIKSAKTTPPGADKTETETTILPRLRKAISQYETQLGKQIYYEVLGARGIETTNQIDSLKLAMQITATLEEAHKLVLTDADVAKHNQGEVS